MPSKDSLKNKGRPSLADKATSGFWMWFAQSKQADSGSAAGAAVTRAGAGKKEGPQESQIVDHCVGAFRFREGGKADSDGVKNTRVVLIEEGMGNFGDGFYYTREALETGVEIFEGKKFYIDHPSRSEEEDRPERSTRDIGGHYEALAVEDDEDGRALLCADLNLVKGESTAWIRDMIAHALEYAKKYPDKSFVGLSINAGGDAEPMALKDFMGSADIPESAKPKLESALEEGVDEVKVVYAFRDATSCDLVTEAGAGGKFLEALEKEKNRMAGPKNKNGKSSKNGSAKHREDDNGGAHGDEDQDKELIKKMLKKHLGDEHSSEGDMQAAMEAYEYHQAEGAESESAAEKAAESVKCAKHMAAKQAKKEADGGKDKKDDEEEESTETDKESQESEADDKKEKNKESAVNDEVIKLRGQVARLLESDRENKLEKHLESLLSKGKLPRSATKTFRESIKGAKSVDEINRAWKLFQEGYRLRGEAEDRSLSVDTEKNVESDGGEESGSGSGEGFGDCVK